MSVFKDRERVYQVLLAPHFSEKASNANEQRQYTFRVARDASKPEIKAAVEELFKVDVEGVTTLNVKPKVKRTFRGVSRTKAWKKAVVRVAEGQEIDFEAM